MNPSASESPMTAKNEEIRTLEITFRYFDYGRDAGGDRAVISGSMRDLGLILTHIRDNACSIHSVHDLADRTSIPRREIESWARLPPVPSP